MKKIILFVAAFTFMISAQAMAMMVLSLNVEQLTNLAEKIFVGTCVSIEPQTDAEGRRIIEVTYAVSETLKGSSESRVSFRQLAPPENGGEDVVRNGIRYHTSDVDLPSYSVGQENMIFLSEDGVLGLTAPIGITQGKFEIRQSVTGEKRIINSMGNEGLFRKTSKSPKIKALTLDKKEKSLLNVTSGDVDLEDFKSLVKKIVQTHEN